MVESVYLYTEETVTSSQDGRTLLQVPVTLVYCLYLYYIAELKCQLTGDIYP